MTDVNDRYRTDTGPPAHPSDHNTATEMPVISVLGVRVGIHTLRDFVSGVTGHVLEKAKPENLKIFLVFVAVIFLVWRLT